METTRTKNWFITINENAECYEQIKEILKGQNLNHYAYIYHNCEEWENGNKNKHIHICLEYHNQIRFSTLQKIFKGSHIEPMKYRNVSYQYLIHKNDSDKTQYDVENVICDSKDYYLTMLDNDEYLYLDSETIIAEIEKGNNSMKGLIKTFGLNQVNHKLGIIKALINECETFSSQELLEHQMQSLLTENAKQKKENLELKQKYEQLLRDYGKVNKELNACLPF